MFWRAAVLRTAAVGAAAAGTATAVAGSGVAAAVSSAPSLPNPSPSAVRIGGLAAELLTLRGQGGTLAEDALRLRMARASSEFAAALGEFATSTGEPEPQVESALASLLRSAHHFARAVPSADVATLPFTIQLLDATVAALPRFGSASNACVCACVASWLSPRHAAAMVAQMAADPRPLVLRGGEAAALLCAAHRLATLPGAVAAEASASSRSEVSRALALKLFSSVKESAPLTVQTVVAVYALAPDRGSAVDVVDALQARFVGTSPASNNGSSKAASGLLPGDTSPTALHALVGAVSSLVAGASSASTPDAPNVVLGAPFRKALAATVEAKATALVETAVAAATVGDATGIADLLTLVEQLALLRAGGEFVVRRLATRSGAPASVGLPPAPPITTQEASSAATAPPASSASSPRSFVAMLPPKSLVVAASWWRRSFALVASREPALSTPLQEVWLELQTAMTAAVKGAASGVPLMAAEETLEALRCFEFCGATKAALASHVERLLLPASPAGCSDSAAVCSPVPTPLAVDLVVAGLPHYMMGPPSALPLVSFLRSARRSLADRWSACDDASVVCRAFAHHLIPDVEAFAAALRRCNGFTEDGSPSPKARFVGNLLRNGAESDVAACGRVALVLFRVRDASPAARALLFEFSGSAVVAAALTGGGLNLVLPWIAESSSVKVDATHLPSKTAAFEGLHQVMMLAHAAAVLLLHPEAWTRGGDAGGSSEAETRERNRVAAALVDRVSCVLRSASTSETNQATAARCFAEDPVSVLRDIATVVFFAAADRASALLPTDLSETASHLLVWYVSVCRALAARSSLELHIAGDGTIASQAAAFASAAVHPSEKQRAMVTRLVERCAPGAKSPRRVAFFRCAVAVHGLESLLGGRGDAAPSQPPALPASSLLSNNTITVNSNNITGATNHDRIRATLLALAPGYDPLFSRRPSRLAFLCSVCQLHEPLHHMVSQLAPQMTPAVAEVWTDAELRRVLQSLAAARQNCRAAGLVLAQEVITRAGRAFCAASDATQHSQLPPSAVQPSTLRAVSGGDDDAVVDAAGGEACHVRPAALLSEALCTLGALGAHGGVLYRQLCALAIHARDALTVGDVARCLAGAHCTSAGVTVMLQGLRPRVRALLEEAAGQLHSLPADGGASAVALASSTGGTPIAGGSGAWETVGLLLPHLAWAFVSDDELWGFARDVVATTATRAEASADHATMASVVLGAVPAFRCAGRLRLLPASVL